MAKFVSIAVLAVSFACALVCSVHAQTPSPGTISVHTDTTCPTIPITDSQQFPSGSQCYSGTITCSNVYSNVAEIGFTFGVLGSGGSGGTIVLFSHGDGTSIDFDPALIAWYNASPQNFQTVEVVWEEPNSTNPFPWEQSQTSSQSSLTSIKQAACRPATLLNWLYNNIYGSGGMCAEGISAGSAAIAYSMAEYNVDYLDAVEFHSGPPLADIRAGCVNDPDTTYTVCGNSNYCNSGTEGSWSASLGYISPAPTDIDQWTNQSNPTCTTVANGSADANAYKAMSIVDGETDSTFYYPSTSVNIWVCAASNTNPVCGVSNPSPNNSGPEADFFADQLYHAGSAINEYRVDYCGGSNPSSEDVGSGLVPDNLYGLGTCALGQTVIRKDMAHNCAHSAHIRRASRAPKLTLP
jgi:hypothetical protein